MSSYCTIKKTIEYWFWQFLYVRMGSQVYSPARHFSDFEGDFNTPFISFQKGIVPGGTSQRWQVVHGRTDAVDGVAADSKGSHIPDEYRTGILLSHWCPRTHW